MDRDIKNGDVLGMEIMVKLEDWNKAISLYSRIVTVGVGQAIAQPLEYRQVEGLTMANPFMTLNNNEAQKLMDELWKCGIRPSEGSGSAGSLRATENHLSDMRKILGKQLGVELGETKKQF